MTRSSLVFVGFAAGVVLGVTVTYAAVSGSKRVVRQGPEGLMSQPVTDIAREFEAINQRLSSIEALLTRPSTDAAEIDPAPSQAIREESTDVRSVMNDRFNELRDQIAAATAGVGEISKSKPLPDTKAVAALRKEQEVDSGKAANRIKGITYRDALLEFGSPTLKIDHNKRVHGPGGGHVVSWLWETPELGYDLMIQFETGAAIYAICSPTAKQFMTSLGND